MPRPRTALGFGALALVVGLIGIEGTMRGQAPQGPERDPARYEETIQAFEAEDRISPPPRGATLFLGSSSITNWDLDEAFPGLTAVKRGYGGSHVSDSIHFAGRILFPYAPRLVVFYAGDADINAGKGPERIVADYRKLVGTLHAELPEARMVIIGVKPSAAHWKHIDVIRETNARVKAFTETDPRLAFADVEPPLLDTNGEPAAEMYAENGLNLSPVGYVAWTSVVRPLVMAFQP